MKTKNLLFFLALIISFGLLMSCGADENEDPDVDDPTDTTEVVDSAAFDFTPEEHKAAIQDQGIAFVNEMEEMSNTAAIETLTSLLSLLYVDESEARLDPVAQIAGSIVDVATRKTPVIEFATKQESDPETLNELWEQNKGVYDWNPTIEDFDFTEGGDVIQVNFPATDGGTSNNAALTLQTYVGVTISNPIDEEYTGDLPAELVLDLAVDGEKTMEYAFDIEYTSEGEPSSISTYLEVVPFKLLVAVNNNETQFSSNVNFTSNENELIGTSVEINGNFDADNIENAEDADEVLTDASFDLRVMNIAFEGSGKIGVAYRTIESALANEGEAGFNYEVAAETIEEALNENIEMMAKYVDSGAPISTVEFYTFVEEDDFDPAYKYIELGARLVFSDGSKIDVEDYFEEGWDQIEEELEQLFEDLEAEIN